jgi:viroplasmin and RNaseH domain-containing protein
MRAPVKAAYVIRFFQLVTEKQLTEAERELLRIKEKIERTEWNHGYYKALQGMLVSRRTNSDNPTFLTTLEPNNKRALLDLKKEFQEKVESRLYTDYDRGFFSAWVDYVSVLKRMNFKAAATVQTAQSQTTAQPETVEEVAEQAQASLEDWQEQTN